MKEVHPDMIATHEEPARVYQGHAFIVEAAVSLGGKSVSPGINVFRFANRIPLLFEQASDVITRTASEVKWANYKINKKEDRIGVFVSLVSTKIPFKVGFRTPRISAESSPGQIAGNRQGIHKRRNSRDQRGHPGLVSFLTSFGV
jgi:DNA topoisomerase VI subunit B